MDRWRSGEAIGGGARVAVVEWSEEEEESPRNWKSARRRSAHLLAEHNVGLSF